MGLNNNQSNNSNKTYLNIVGGKITRRYKEHLPEENGKPVTFSREIKDKNSGQVIKTVIERYYDSIDGIVINAEIDTTGNFGAMLVFTLLDGEEFLLSIPLDSSYGVAIMKKLPNVDPNKVVTFSPFSFESKDEMKNGEPKKIVGCNLFQENSGWNKDKVPPKWTQENQGSLPQWVKSETTGKWDNTAQLDFLGGHFRQWAKGIGGVPTNDSVEDPMEMERRFAEEQAAKSQAKTETPSGDGPVEDLPF